MSEYNLNRFIKAQNDCFDQVCAELKNGEKETHWMWYIFPQIIGLGNSSTSIYYALSDINEAKAYYDNDILKERLLYLVDILVNLETNDPTKIFLFPDNLKFWASMTLFNKVDPNELLFKKALDKFFQGRLHTTTLEILADQEKK